MPATDPEETPPLHAPPPVREPFSHHRRLALNAIVLGGAEILTLAFCLFVGGVVRTYWKGDPMFASWMWFVLLGWLLGAWILRILPGWGLGSVEELRRQIMLLVAVFGGTTAILFWGKAAHETSRFTLTIGLLLSVVLIPFIRIRVKRRLIEWRRWGLPAAVYTDAATGTRVLEALKEEQGIGLNPVGVFCDGVEQGANPFGEFPILGDLRGVTPEAAAAIVALPGLPSSKLLDLLDGPISRYRRVVIVPDLTEAPSLWVKPCDLGGMLGLEISHNLLDPYARFVKRFADLCFCLVTLPLWLPLCLLIAALIWLSDRRNPLFLQERVGLRGQSFHAWKFRTMHPAAEQLLQKHLKEDPELRREWENHFKLRVDPRITRIGRLLRRTSLDELPQIVNVLFGEMSIVGPRPLPRYHFEQLPDRVKRLRDRVRPGITGLWQVSGRSEAGHAGMPRWDTYYVRNWSVWLDIVIMVRTSRTVISGRGAF